MATKHFINKLVADGGAGNGLIKPKKLMAILGILWLWSFCGVASVPAARAQNVANLAIDSPGATVEGNVVNFHTTSGLNDADWRYWWVVRGPRNQWTFAGPSGNLDLPPGDYRATVTARDRYGDTAYQDTSTFRVESPTATSTVGRSADNINYRNDGQIDGGRTYNDGSYGRYNNRDNGYYDDYNRSYDPYGGGYRDGEKYNDGYYDNRYGNPYGDNQYHGAYDRTYDDRYDNVSYGNGYDEEYGGNINDGYEDGYDEYGGYDKVRCGAHNGYDETGYGGEYNGEYHQDITGHEGGPYDDGDLGSYDNGEDDSNY